MCKDDSLVSVIIPIYNTDQYLKRCIDSVLQQTYRNIQIILVDDGSCDLCFDICKQYENDNENIIFISIEHKGAASARNEGLKVSTGDYIVFVDSDDYVDNDYIEKLVNYVNKYNADVFCFGTTKAKNTLLLNKDKLRYYYLKYNLYFNESVVRKLFKKEIFNDIKFYENHYYEDTYITYKLIEKINKAVYYYSDSYHITERVGSLTRSGIDDRYYDCVCANKEIYEYYKSTQYEKIALKKYIGVSLYYLFCADNNQSKYISKVKKEIDDIVKKEGVFIFKPKQLLAYMYMKLIRKL